MKELVIISGKGGTGKSSLTLALADLASRYFAGKTVLADCDVDAADLHLILNPLVVKTEEFFSGLEAEFIKSKCIECGKCTELCRFDAVLDPIACEGCGVCARFCPVGAIKLKSRHCGRWMISNTFLGPLVHAQLDPAGENSGKLVFTVRQLARDLAEDQKRELIISDGPPGIGCPTIASLTGADLALIVTEPTVSAEHDLIRALELTRHFKIKTAVCINKWDINPQISERITQTIQSNPDLLMAGRVRYDREVTLAQIKGKIITQNSAGDCCADIVQLWQNLITKGLIDD